MSVEPAEGEWKEPTPEEALAELEARQRRPRAFVRAPVALVGLLLAALLGWEGRHDFTYLFTSRQPLTLGAEGGYALGEIQPNRYVQLHGIPTLRALYVDEKSGPSVIVGLQGSPFLVLRAPLPGEERTKGRVPPPPDQRPFGVRGRLLTQAQAGPYADAFPKFRDFNEVQPHGGELYLVIEGDRPGKDPWMPLSLGLLAAFATFNAWMLVRALRAAWPTR